MFRTIAIVVGLLLVLTPCVAQAGFWSEDFSGNLGNWEFAGVTLNQNEEIVPTTDFTSQIVAGTLQITSDTAINVVGFVPGSSWENTYSQVTVTGTINPAGDTLFENVGLVANLDVFSNSAYALTVRFGDGIASADLTKSTNAGQEELATVSLAGFRDWAATDVYDLRLTVVDNALSATVTNVTEGEQIGIGATDPGDTDLLGAGYAGVLVNANLAQDSLFGRFDNVSTSNVPEPSSFLLASCCLAGLGLSRRRRWFSRKA